MFGDLVDPGPRLGAHARSAVPLTLVGHALLAAIVIIVPLTATDDMPKLPPGDIVLVSPDPPDPPFPPVARRASPVRPNHATAIPSATIAVAPRDPPTEIAAGLATGTSSVRPPGEPSGGVSEFDIGNRGPVPLVADVPVLPQMSSPVRPGGVVKTPIKVRHVPPVYPAIAQQARVDGVVIIEAVVGVDGRVVEAHVLRSKPLLDEAALSAVRQWEFTPTTLNGVPVPVIMTVTVNFTLR
jgi:protein TonB